MTGRPSYILFITDQQRFDNLGCNGHPVLKTPNIDAMAAEGVNYRNFYVSSPVCMPNRASLVTCRMPSSHGVRSLGVPLSHDNVTFIDLLRAAGYDTALIGKSHLQLFFDNPQDWRDVEETGFGRSLLHRLYPRPLARILRAVGGAGRAILPFLFSPGYASPP